MTNKLSKKRRLHRGGSYGYNGQPNQGLQALLENAANPPGTHSWRRTHGDKKPLLLCVALRAAVARQIDLREITVYRCQLRDRPSAIEDGPVHWHIGHVPFRGVGAPAFALRPDDLRM